MLSYAHFVNAIVPYRIGATDTAENDPMQRPHRARICV